VRIRLPARQHVRALSEPITHINGGPKNGGRTFHIFLPDSKENGIKLGTVQLQNEAPFLVVSLRRPGHSYLSPMVRISRIGVSHPCDKRMVACLICRVDGRCLGAVTYATDTLTAFVLERVRGAIRRGLNEYVCHYRSSFRRAQLRTFGASAQPVGRGVDCVGFRPTAARSSRAGRTRTRPTGRETRGGWARSPCATPPGTAAFTAEAQKEKGGKSTWKLRPTLFFSNVHARITVGDAIVVVVRAGPSEERLGRPRRSARIGRVRCYT